MGVLMKATKDQIMVFYGQTLKRCSEAFASLDEKEWGKKASDEWTARQHLANLVATCEAEELPLTRQALAGEPPHIAGFEKREDQMAFREVTMAKLENLPIPELLQRFHAAFGEHRPMLESLTEGDL